MKSGEWRFVLARTFYTKFLVLDTGLQTCVLTFLFLTITWLTGSEVMNVDTSCTAQAPVAVVTWP